MADFGKQLEALERSGLVDRMMEAGRPNVQRCMTCGRETPILEVYTGEARQRMCEDCKRIYRDLAKIVCRRCGKFCGFMRAGTTGNGFSVARDQTLHVPWCDNCDPERAKKEGSAVIEEVERYALTRRNNELAGAVSAGKGGVL